MLTKMKIPYRDYSSISPKKRQLQGIHQYWTHSFFTKRTGHLKMRYSLFFSLSEHNKHTKIHSQYRKN